MGESSHTPQPAPTAPSCSLFSRLLTLSGVEFGDYIGDCMGLALGSGVAHPAWVATSNSTDNPNGTTNFDAYTDKVTLLDEIFSDGFESGDTSAWMGVEP